MPGPSSQSRPIQRKDRSNWSTDSSVERARSVSSMRRTNVPPFLRAKSQLKRAVLTPPTCNNPVGLGAYRTRISLLSMRLNYHANDALESSQTRLNGVNGLPEGSVRTHDTSTVGRALAGGWHHEDATPASRGGGRQDHALDGALRRRHAAR